MDLPSPQWFAWKIKSGKFEKTKQYLESNVPEILEILYPFKDSANKRKKAGLYDLYIFLRYTNSNETWHKIHSIPIGIQYIGPCAEKDISCIVESFYNI